MQVKGGIIVLFFFVSTKVRITTGQFTHLVTRTHPDVAIRAPRT